MNTAIHNQLHRQKETVSAPRDSGACTNCCSISLEHPVEVFWLSGRVASEYHENGSKLTGECLKCPTMRLPELMISEILCCDSTPSETTSCSVCAMHGKLGKAASLMAFSMFRALSLKIAQTFSLGMLQDSNIRPKAPAKASAVTL